MHTNKENASTFIKLTISTHNSLKKIKKEKQNSNLQQKHTTLIHNAHRFFVVFVKLCQRWCQIIEFHIREVQPVPVQQWSRHRLFMSNSKHLNIKICILQSFVIVWGPALVKAVINSRFYKTQGLYWLTKDLSASQEVLCTMALVSLWLYIL